MDIAPHHFAASHELDTADLACTFMEQEVGRHRWQRNWPKWKEQFTDDNALKRRIQTWLNYIQVNHDPQAIIDYLDRMVATQVGKWL